MPSTLILNLEGMKKLYTNFINHLFLWCGSKLFEDIVISSKDEEVVDAILFSNNAEIVEKYIDIEYT